MNANHIVHVSRLGHQLAQLGESLPATFDKWLKAPVTNETFRLGPQPFPDPVEARTLLTEVDDLLESNGTDILFEMQCAQHSLRAHADDLRAVLERIRPFAEAWAP